MTRTAAVSEVKDEPGSIAGRVIEVFATDDSYEEDLTELRGALDREREGLQVIASHVGTVASQVVEDELNESALAKHPRTRSILEEAFRHGNRCSAPDRSPGWHTSKT